MLLLALLVFAAHFSQGSGFALMRFNPNIAKLITVECSSQGMNVSFGQKLTVSFLKPEQDYVKSLDVLGFSIGTTGTCMGKKYENGSLDHKQYNYTCLCYSFGQKLTVSFLKPEQDYVKSLDVLGFSIGTTGTCMGKKYENGSYWETSALFSYYSCDVQSHPFPGGINYTANAVILVRKARYYEIPISCTILDQPIRDVNLNVRREDGEVVPMKNESIPLNSQLKYAFAVNSTVLPSFKDLYTYTSNCAVLSYLKGPVSFILAGGCPLYHTDSFMSAIYQAQTTLHWSVNTGVHVNFDKNTIPKESVPTPISVAMESVFTRIRNESQPPL